VSVRGRLIKPSIHSDWNTEQSQNKNNKNSNHGLSLTMVAIKKIYVARQLVQFIGFWRKL
jgi:hypothetical protein